MASGHAMVVALTVLVVLLLAGVAYQRIGARRDRRRFPAPGRMIDVAGHRLHAICHGGGGPLVVLESGIAASSLSWAIVQRQIASFTRVCAYDRAGLAWSEAASSPRTLDRIVEELSAVIDRIDPLAPLVLVGHSFGSFVVRTYAARHPRRLVGLVLVDPPTEWLVTTPERARMLRGGRFLAGVGAVLAYLGVVRACLEALTKGAPGAARGFVEIFGPTTARTLERLVGEVRKLPPDVHPVVQALWCQPKCFRAMGAYFTALERERASLAEAVPPPAIPIIVISSGNQPPDGLAAHRALAASSTKGRHVVAQGSSHWVPFDRPELIVGAVRELVESLVPPATARL